ncbi:MAG: T9SS type A sorting domain-containing protein [Bacteroidetes bacterium]|nr:T9SS type A sorting domain-containing protein [Bacteroidota bacterium]
MKLHFTPAKAAGLLMAASMLLSFIGNAQTYNNFYPESAGNMWSTGQARSLVSHNAACAMTSTGTGFDPNMSADVLLTQIKPSGLHHASWRFGQAGEDEYGNSVCQSIVNANEFIICGRSSNYQMLVMKVNSSGSVIWSKEITFPYAMVEGVVVASFNNSPSNNGYIISGYANALNGSAALVAVRISENGTVVWKFEYPVAVKVIVTDAIVRHYMGDRIFSMTGYENTGNVFYVNISTIDGLLFSYCPGARYNISTPASLGAVRMTEYKKNGIPQLAFTVARGSFPMAVLAFGVDDSYASVTPIWSYTYAASTQYDYHVSSIINLSSSRLCILVNRSPASTIGNAVAMLMELDYSGGLLGATSYNAAHEVTSSLIESCGTGYPTYSAAYLTPNGRWVQRVVKRSGAAQPGCATAFSLTATSVNMTTAQLSISQIVSGVESNYPVQATSVSASAYNCLGNPLRLAAPQTGDETEVPVSGIAYPNPAHDFVTIQAGSEPVTVELYAINGQLLLSRQFTGTSQLSLEDAEPGVYILRKVHANGSAEVEKLIVE